MSSSHNASLNTFLMEASQIVNMEAIARRIDMLMSHIHKHQRATNQEQDSFSNQTPATQSDKAVSPRLPSTGPTR